MVKICRTGLLKLNFESRPKKRIFRILPKIFACHWMKMKIFFANFQILGPLGCQGWVAIPQNVKKSQNHCTLMYMGITSARCYYTIYNMYIVQYCILYIKVQWFWLFFTFWGITTHPWHPKGPRIWKLAKKKFQLHAWPAEIFVKNRKMRFFCMISKFNIRSLVWQIFTIFTACFIYGIPNTHTKF